MTETIDPPNKQASFSCLQVLGMILLSTLLAIIGTVLVFKFFLFPGPFKPVVLSEREEQQLSEKLAAFEDVSSQTAAQASRGQQLPQKKIDPTTTLQPEKYSEKGATRQIHFTERELNSLVAKNTDLAEKVAIDLSKDMISVKLLIPMDPDFPFLGGKTLKAKAGAEFAYREERPIVKLRGVSIMGVPMPNAWLGGLKNIDLVSEFGGDAGFWQSFSEGVQSIDIIEGSLKIQLKE